MTEPVTKRIDIQYYALFRGARGKDQETVQTLSSTARELYVELGFDAIFPFDPARLRVAINDEFSDWNCRLSNEDLIVFIAPVAGG